MCALPIFCSCFWNYMLLLFIDTCDPPSNYRFILYLVVVCQIVWCTIVKDKIIQRLTNLIIVDSTEVVCHLEIWLALYPCSDWTFPYNVSVENYPSNLLTSYIQSALYCLPIGRMTNLVPRFLVTRSICTAFSGPMHNTSAILSTDTLWFLSRETYVLILGISSVSISYEIFGLTLHNDDEISFNNMSLLDMLSRYLYKPVIHIECCSLNHWVRHYNRTARHFLEYDICRVSWRSTLHVDLRTFSHFIFNWHSWLIYIHKLMHEKKFDLKNKKTIWCNYLRTMRTYCS